MAGRGRPPKPTALKALEGNPGKRVLNDSEPKFERRLPRCPRHLSAEAKREWHRVVRELYEAGLLTGVDRGALAAYCQAWATWVEAEKKITEVGAVLETDKGYQYPSPWVGISKSAVESMRRFMVEFGMTPSSRSRVQVRQAEEEDPFEAFVRQRLGEA